MTAAPINALIDYCSPTKSCAGRSAVAPKPIVAANLASLRAAEPLGESGDRVRDWRVNVGWRENTPPRPLAAARPIAKSP